MWWRSTDTLRNPRVENYPTSTTELVLVGVYESWTLFQLASQRKKATCQKINPENKHVTKEKGETNVER